MKAALVLIIFTFTSISANANMWKRKRMTSVCDAFFSKAEMAKIFNKKFIDNAGNPNYHTKFHQPNNRNNSACAFITSQPGQMDHSYFSFDIHMDYQNDQMKKIISGELKKRFRAKILKTPKSFAKQPSRYYYVDQEGQTQAFLINESLGLWVEYTAIKKEESDKLIRKLNYRLLKKIKENPQFGRLPRDVASKKLKN